MWFLQQKKNTHNEILMLIKHFILQKIFLASVNAIQTNCSKLLNSTAFSLWQPLDQATVAQPAHPNPIRIVSYGFGLIDV